MSSNYDPIIRGRLVLVDAFVSSNYDPIIRGRLVLVDAFIFIVINVHVGG